MGRSRAVSRPPDDDHHAHTHSRSKKRKTVASSNVESSVATPPSRACSWENSGGGGGLVALYHCNYCNKDITGTVRLRCALCPDFDLCVECFSVGVEVTPHKSNHPYRVMDNLSFPLICPDWNADEEILLLEGIEMYGFGNWPEVAEHVGTKTKSQCINHYNAMYMSSPCFPLPDLSHVMGKSREELLAMAKAHTIDEGTPDDGKLMPKAESSLPSLIKNEGPAKEIHFYHSTFFQESPADRSVGEKKPRVSGEEGPSMLELSGYNFNRQEFEIEYDNDAEHMLADMEFKHTDTDAERDLKLRVLHIYSKRLDERKRRKNFILERNLLHPDPFEKSLSPEEEEIYRRFKVFMRFHSKDEHEELMKCVIEERRLAKRIQDLQEARVAGCQTAAEAHRFIEDRKREAEERRLKENIQASKVLQSHHLKSEDDGSHRGDLKGPSLLVGNQDSSSCTEKPAVSVFADNWDITGLPGADLISESERQLCCEMRILPSHYLKMLQTMTQEILRGNITKKPDAHHLFKVDPNKVDKLYDMLVQKGFAQLG